MNVNKIDVTNYQCDSGLWVRLDDGSSKHFCIGTECFDREWTTEEAESAINEEIRDLFDAHNITCEQSIIDDAVNSIMIYVSPRVN